MTTSQRREAYRRALEYWADCVGYSDRRPVAWSYGLREQEAADIDAQYQPTTADAHGLRLVRERGGTQ